MGARGADRLRTDTARRVGLDQTRSRVPRNARRRSRVSVPRASRSNAASRDDGERERLRAQSRQHLSEGAVCFGESFADTHLHEADVLGILAEALPADVEVVLANDTPLVCAHAAVEEGRGGEGSAKVRGEIGQGWGIKP